MAEGSVLIVGAGPTGLVLALWLTKLGVEVSIIDKTAEPGTTRAPWPSRRARSNSTGSSISPTPCVAARPSRYRRSISGSRANGGRLPLETLARISRPIPSSRSSLRTSTSGC